MKTYLECIPCFMQQALRAGKLITTDDKIHKEILDHTGSLIHTFNLNNTPAESGAKVYEIISEITGVKDPYKQIKEDNIKQAKKLIPDLKNLIKQSHDPLLTAVKIAIAGNVIDFGVNESFNIEEDLNEILTKDFAISDYEDFKKTADKAKTILYFGDNAGESVFDKLLIEEVNKQTYYAVREIPIINDATYEDAVNSGLNEVSEIISSGVKAPGAIVSQFTENVKKLFNSADMVISKGQGNYEGLSNNTRTIFFLLKAKCKVLADDIGVKKGSIILKATNLIKQ